MEKLARAIKRESARFGESPISTVAPELHEAALRWAEHSLRTYKGKLLRRALDISQALADFTNELEPNP